MVLRRDFRNGPNGVTRIEVAVTYANVALRSAPATRCIGLRGIIRQKRILKLSRSKLHPLFPLSLPSWEPEESLQKSALMYALSPANRAQNWP